MHESIKEMGYLLKTARQQKKLSQRAFGVKVGVPQSHISKIENGQVNLQLSSLIEFSRVLDLELMLIPRGLVPAVQALKQGLFGKETQIPMYRLEESDENG